MKNARIQKKKICHAYYSQGLCLVSVSCVTTEGFADVHDLYTAP